MHVTRCFCDARDVHSDPFMCTQHPPPTGPTHGGAGQLPAFSWRRARHDCKSMSHEGQPMSFEFDWIVAMRQQI